MLATFFSSDVWVFCGRHKKAHNYTNRTFASHFNTVMYSHKCNGLKLMWSKIQANTHKAVQFWPVFGYCRLSEELELHVHSVSQRLLSCDTGQDGLEWCQPSLHLSSSQSSSCDNQQPGWARCIIWLAVQAKKSVFSFRRLTKYFILHISG